MNSLAHGGSGFAARYAAAALSHVQAYREQTSGITQVMFMNQLAGLDDLSGIPDLLKVHGVCVDGASQGSWWVWVMVGI